MHRPVLGLAAFLVLACSDRSERQVAMDPAPPSTELVRVDTGRVDTGRVDTGSVAPAEEATPPAPAPRPARARRKPKARAPEPPAYRQSEPDTVRLTDTVRMADTVTRADTVRVTDAVAVADSLVLRDSAPAPAPVSTPAPAPTAAATPDSTPAPLPAEDSGFDGVRALPVGTHIQAALTDSLDSRRDSAGRRLSAEVAQNVADRTGTVIVPAGSRVRLTVVKLAPAGSRSAADGQLELKVNGIEVGDSMRVVSATVGQIPHELRGRGVTGSEAAKVGAGTAVGAVAGRVIGGNTKGAVIGGVVGAAGGAAVAAQTAKRDVVVKARTIITLVLDSPLVATAETP